jgi:hypothetical protein
MNVSLFDKRIQNLSPFSKQAFLLLCISECKKERNLRKRKINISSDISMENLFIQMYSHTLIMGTSFEFAPQQCNLETVARIQKRDVLMKVQSTFYCNELLFDISSKMIPNDDTNRPKK